MFDLSIAEMAFIAVVALLVIGPKELPILLRTVGRWVGRAKRLVHGVMDQLELNDLQADVKTIQNDAGEMFESYDLSEVQDKSRKPKSKGE
ncbi:MAG: twin-arginine translocase TatA/TatE family subunit [Rickettsiales bacterium]|nr:twin-arginine translocase TatA/TatE family subunit [Rickettsiales bacterium]